MQQRDIIKDQIEQLGQVIGKGLALILGLKNEGDILESIDQVAEVFDTELNLDLKKLMLLEQDEFQQVIEEKFQNFEEPLHHLGTLLFEIALHCGPEGELRQVYAQKALWTFNYLNTISATFSMERMEKIKSLKKWI